MSENMKMKTIVKHILKEENEESTLEFAMQYSYPIISYKLGVGRTVKKGSLRDTLGSRREQFKRYRDSGLQEKGISYKDFIDAKSLKFVICNAPFTHALERAIPEHQLCDIQEEVYSETDWNYRQTLQGMKEHVIKYCEKLNEVAPGVVQAIWINDEELYRYNGETKINTTITPKRAFQQIISSLREDPYDESVFYYDSTIEGYIVGVSSSSNSIGIGVELFVPQTNFRNGRQVQSTPEIPDKAEAAIRREIFEKLPEDVKRLLGSESNINCFVECSSYWFQYGFNKNRADYRYAYSSICYKAIAKGMRPHNEEEDELFESLKGSGYEKLVKSTWY